MRVLLLVLLVAVAVVNAGDPLCQVLPKKGRNSVSTLSYNEAVGIHKRVKRANRPENQAAHVLGAAENTNNCTSIDQLADTYVDVPGLGPSSISDINPTYYKNGNGDASLTCQIDCMSQIAALGNRPFFQSCKYRYYKYGALVDTQGCYYNTDISNAQAALVQSICINYSGCIPYGKSNTLADVEAKTEGLLNGLLGTVGDLLKGVLSLTNALVRTAVGANTYRLPAKK